MNGNSKNAELDVAAKLSNIDLIHRFANCVVRFSVKTVDFREAEIEALVLKKELLRRMEKDSACPNCGNAS